MTDTMHQTAVIAGVSGIVGRAAAIRLSRLGWRVIGLSRRPPEPMITGVEHIAADLGDAGATRTALAPVAARTAGIAGRNRRSRFRMHSSCGR